MFVFRYRLTFSPSLQSNEFYKRLGGTMRYDSNVVVAQLHSDRCACGKAKRAGVIAVEKNPISNPKNLTYKLKVFTRSINKQ